MATPAKFTYIRNGLATDRLVVTEDVRVGPNTQFAEVRTAEKTQLYELKSSYGFTVLRDRKTETGSATVTNDVGDGEYTLQVTDTSSTALLESAERGRYVPGMDAEVGIGFRLGSEPTGDQVAEWGYFDSNNGFIFGHDSAGVYVKVLRDGVVKEKTYQNEWNVDRLDGTEKSTTNPSGITLDTLRGNIYQVVFAWYGYGTANFQILAPDPETKEQVVVTVHRYTPDGETSVKEPNLPITATVQNGAGDSGTFTGYVGGRQYSVVGTYNPSFRITSETIDGATVDVGVEGVYDPIITFRRKAAYDSVSVKLSEVEALTNNNIELVVILDGTLTGASFGSLNNIDPTETAVEVDTSATAITGGTKIWSGLVRGGGGVNTNVGSRALPTLDIPNTDEVTLAGRAITTQATVTANLKVREQW